MHYVTPLMRLPRSGKRKISMLGDAFMMLFACSFSYLLRYGHLDLLANTTFLLAFGLVMVFTIAVMRLLGLYGIVIRYVGLRTMVLFGVVSILSGIFLKFAIAVSQVNFSVSVNLNYIFFAFMGIGGVRLLLREIVMAVVRGSTHKVIIYGAGASGRQLLLALENSSEYRAVAFIDDDPSLIGAKIKDVKVYSLKSVRRIVHEQDVSKILLAVPSLKRSARAELIKQLEPLGLQVLSIPGMAELVDGKMRIDELQDVKVEDLLGRDSVEPIASLMTANSTGKCILVTGAGGSIGSELCRQLVMLAPKQLILFDMSEYALYEIHSELLEIKHKHMLDVVITPHIGSIQNQQRVTELFTDKYIDTVYHAAAYKHVPLVESNVVEALNNNVFGTLNLAKAAAAFRASTFVLISTDKAVRPKNVMGASKRLAEFIVQDMATQHQETAFCCVRFGNVLGSSGSVVPLFRRQIKEGKAVTLTHEDVTRYFMTIPEAAQLVIQAGAMASDASVFVLDMGEPVRVYELAKRMIHLMGREVKSKDNPHGDIEIRIVGLRPGEKLHEELFFDSTIQNTRHPLINTAAEHSISTHALEEVLRHLSEAIADNRLDEIRQILIKTTTGSEGFLSHLAQPAECNISLQ